jgi:hypothetical protein
MAHCKIKEIYKATEQYELYVKRQERKGRRTNYNQKQLRTYSEFSII